jgi:FHS family Na+ dependent glucose MFS transporter 1
MNGLHFFFGVGSFVGPLIVALVVEAGGRSTAAYWVLALLVLPVIAWLFGLPSPSVPAAREQEQPVEESERSSARAGEGLLVGLIALLLLLYVAAEAAFGGWIYTYAVALDLSDGATAAYLTSAFWGALTLGRLLGIPLAARFRPRAILLADLAGCLVSTGILLLWPGSREVLWVGSLGLGLSMASIFPTAISLAERRVRITGQVTAWFLIGSSVGAMLLPWLIGQLFEPVGPQVTIWIILLDLAAAVGMLAALLTVSDRRISAPEAGGGS